VFRSTLGNGLQGLCETRWVERHDGHLQFQGDSLVKVCEALRKIATWDDAASSTDAELLLHTLSSSAFLVASVCLHDILGMQICYSLPN